jgi:glycine reductase complex component B subunit alpha and beta
MRLDLGLVQAKHVQFGPRTAIEDHVLFVDRDELVSLLQQEPLFDRVEVALAHPGESCRIIRVLDVVQPRYRLNGPNFPGALDPMGLVGDGHTRVLKNVLIVETSEGEARARSIIDMRGPATAYSPFGDMHNVVLLPRPVSGADRDEFRLAVKKAGLRTSAYLAAAARDVAPDEIKTYELPPVAFNQGPKELPRIAYVFPIHSHQHRHSRKRRSFTAAISTDLCRRSCIPMKFSTAR